MALTSFLLLPSFLPSFSFSISHSLGNRLFSSSLISSPCFGFSYLSLISLRSPPLHFPPSLWIPPLSLVTSAFLSSSPFHFSFPTTHNLPSAPYLASYSSILLQPCPWPSLSSCLPPVLFYLLSLYLLPTFSLLSFPFLFPYSSPKGHGGRDTAKQHWDH